ncbi:MAG: PilW family protein [Elainellaceae cyanobacterium]
MVSILRALKRCRRNPNRGFTLIELLITVAVGGLIISGLMYFVIDLTRTDQREGDRTETQRDLRAALDYINSELERAVYVYDNNCLQGIDEDPADQIPPCNGRIPQFLNLSPGMTPVLAFWKLQPLPDPIRDECFNGTAGAGVSCASGSSYTLVVYSIGVPPGDNPPAPLDNLEGEAGIFRQAMTINTANNPNYVGPFNDQAPRFRDWPDVDRDGEDDDTAAGGAPVFNQGPDLLVDFVASGDDPIGPNACPATADYELVPPNGPSSFYVCVNDGIDVANAGNQDIILFLQGSSANRSGLYQEGNAFRPTLESRTFIRGAIDKNPRNL